MKIREFIVNNYFQIIPNYWKIKLYEYFKIFFCVIYEGINKHEEIINKKNLFNKKKKINIKGDKNKCKNIDIFF